jgi:tetratricopeptide (TPR) repeat protein
MNSDEEAVIVGERSVQVLDSSQDALGKMASRITLSTILWRKADYEAAHKRIFEAKKLLSKRFERRWQGQLLGMQALIEAGMGKSLKAMISFQRALNINRQIGNRMQSVVALYGVGNALLDAGKTRQAETMLGQALSLAQAIKYQAFQAVIMTSLAQVKLVRRNYAQTKQLAEQILQDSNLTSDQVAEADAKILLGRVNIAQKQFKLGRNHLMQGLTLSIDVQNQLTTIRALLGFAEYHTQKKQVQTATELSKSILNAAPSFEKTQAENLLKSLGSELEPENLEPASLSNLDDAVEKIMTEHLDVLIAQL